MLRSIVLDEHQGRALLVALTAPRSAADDARVLAAIAGLSEFFSLPPAFLVARAVLRTRLADSRELLERARELTAGWRSVTVCATPILSKWELIARLGAAPTTSHAHNDQ